MKPPCGAETGTGSRRLRSVPVSLCRTPRDGGERVGDACRVPGNSRCCATGLALAGARPQVFHRACLSRLPRAVPGITPPCCWPGVNAGAGGWSGSWRRGPRGPACRAPERCWSARRWRPPRRSTRSTRSARPSAPVEQREVAAEIHRVAGGVSGQVEAQSLSIRLVRKARRLLGSIGWSLSGFRNW